VKETPERFLQSIYSLSEKGKYSIKSVDVGKTLGLSRPDVFRALKALKVFGYINQKPYGKITLSERGKEKAEQMLKIHEVLTSLFTNALGLSQTEAEMTSYKIENILSDSAITKIVEYVDKNNPKRD